MREAVIGQLTETGSGLMRPSLKRAGMVVDQAIAYWGGGDVEELGTVSGFVLAVFAIDDELDVGAAADSVEMALERYLPWCDNGGGVAGQGDVQRMLRRVEGDFAVGDDRKQLLARWRLEGEKLVTAMWREAEWRVRGQMPAEDEYLENGDGSVAIPWMAATMAGLLGELAATGEGREGRAIGEAARACRLLNDAGSWNRERGTGTPNLVPVLMVAGSGGERLSEDEAMKMVRGRVGEALECFYETSSGCKSEVVGRIRRLVEVLVEHYEAGDFPTVTPTVTEAK